MSQRTESVRRVRVTPLTRWCRARAGARTARPDEESATDAIEESGSDAAAARRCRAKSRPVFDRPGLQGRVRSVKLDSRAALRQEVATDGVRKACRARAPDSPCRASTRMYEQPGQTEKTGRRMLARRYRAKNRPVVVSGWRRHLLAGRSKWKDALSLRDRRLREYYRTGDRDRSSSSTNP